VAKLARSAGVGGGCRRCGGFGIGPEAGRHAAGLSPRQPGQHVDPRGGDLVDDHADDGVFNNLVLYDQHIKQNTLATIRPELATSWSWNEDGTELTFQIAA